MRDLRKLAVIVLMCGLSLLPAAAADKKDKNAAKKKAAAATTLDVNTAQYIIGAGDVLAINVWHEQELSRAVPVRPDGKITLPLVGEMVVAGKTPDQVRNEIAEKLKSYIGTPEVTVMMQEVNSRNVNVIGEVQKPGTYPLVKSLTVLDALAMAGGFRDFAKTKGIYVLRKMPDSTSKRFPFNYNQVIKGKKSDENIELQPDDTIVVP